MLHSISAAGGRRIHETMKIKESSRIGGPGGCSSPSACSSSSFAWHARFIDKIAGSRLIAGYQMGSCGAHGAGVLPGGAGRHARRPRRCWCCSIRCVEEGPRSPKFHFRPLISIGLSSLAFAYLLKPLGLVLASVALVFISAYGGHEFKWKEVAIMSVVLVIFSVLVFVKGLSLPFPICPDFIEVCPIR